MNLSHVSASQLKTFSRCQRLWFFEKVRKLPDASEQYHFVFGKVLHAVFERYLLQDDAGNGDPPFPEDWDAKLDPEDASHIRNLYDLAIDEGILAPHPDRQVEARLDLPGRVPVIGYVDLLLPGVVTDWKTTKSSSYVPTPEKLEGDIQANTYGLWYLETQDTEAEEVTIRWFYFRKDLIKVHRVEGKITREHAKGTFQPWLDRQSFLMQKIAARPRQPWPKVPATFPGPACHEYGGCRFVTICAGRESPDRYRKRMLKIAGS